MSDDSSSSHNHKPKSLRCNSAATNAKNSNVGPRPVPSSPTNSTSNILFRLACTYNMK